MIDPQVILKQKNWVLNLLKFPNQIRHWLDPKLKRILDSRIKLFERITCTTLITRDTGNLIELVISPLTLSSTSPAVLVPFLVGTLLF